MSLSFAGAPARRFRCVVSLALSSVVLAACGSGSSGDGSETELVFNSFIPENAHNAQAAAAWMDEIEEESGGRINFQRHWGGALADVLESNDAVGQGRIDVGLNSLGYEPEQFFLTDGLLKIPYQPNDMVAISAAISEMHESYEEPVAEFSRRGLRMLAAVPTTPLVLNLKDKPVTEADELEGLSIRGLGETSSVDAALNAVDANPMGIPAIEVYTSLQRGVVDGQMTLGFLDAPAWGIEEVTEHWIDPGFGPYAAAYLLMNEETYQDLPEDLRDIVDRANENLMPNYVGNILPDAAASACEDVTAADITLTTMAEEDQQAWADLFLEDYVAEWKTVVNDRGVHADEYLATFEAAKEVNASDFEDRGAFLGCES